MPVLSTIVSPPASRKAVSFARQDLEDLGAVDRDVVRVLGARDHGEQGLVDRDDAQVVGGNGAEDGVDGPARGCLGVRHQQYLSSAFPSADVTAPTR